MSDPMADKRLRELERIKGIPQVDITLAEIVAECCQEIRRLREENEKWLKEIRSLLDEEERLENENAKLRAVVDAANLGLTRIGMGEPVTPKLFAEYHEALRELDEGK